MYIYIYIYMYTYTRVVCIYYCYNIQYFAIVENNMSATADNMCFRA